MIRRKQQAKQVIFSHLLSWFLRGFFQLLYHQLAWIYDFIAWIVSLGQWQDWIQAGIPYLDLDSTLVVEIGFGPGHLQSALIKKGVCTFGIDQSPQMCRQASRRLCKQQLRSNLVNARSQQLPFPSNSIPQILSTFPSEYISDPLSLQELLRVLSPGGKVVIILFAWITGKNILERFMAWLFHVTGETPAWNEQYLDPIRDIGFLVHTEVATLPRSNLMLVHLQKPVES